eukprot:TRINITY_DN95537_c0_g1_i1.p1 TRINITY_DN95537_c0_g1~~TRINITY_DN95537_c0_g1_i1.p1  ORF type:complete len:323 (-),score=71.22 TRINITY_DN95537_c0_g1_i1:8-955(-)
MALMVSDHQMLEQVYRFCQERPGGVTQAELNAAGWTDNAQVMKIVNALMREQRLQPYRMSGDKVFFKAVDPATAAKFQGLDDTAKNVYQHIEKAADKGAWSKSLKEDTNMHQSAITKAIKDLINRQLIKEVKSVQNRNRKVYMLFDMEPSREVSGGTWYLDGEFNHKWVDKLRSHCQDFLQQVSGRGVALDEIHRYVTQQPIGGPQVPTEDDVNSILRTLELEEEVSKEVREDGKKIFTLSKGVNVDLFSSRVPSFLTRQPAIRSGLVVPCLCCPLRDECCVGGRICPEKCEYITQWLQRSERGDQDKGIGVIDW